MADTNPATNAGGAGANNLDDVARLVPGGFRSASFATNQCTGNRAFQGEQDADPLNGTDCRLGSPGAGPVPVFGDLPQVLAPRWNEVRIAELSFGSAVRVK